MFCERFLSEREQSARALCAPSGATVIVQADDDDSDQARTPSEILLLRTFRRLAAADRALIVRTAQGIEALGARHGRF